MASEDTWLLSPEKLLSYVKEFDHHVKGWELLLESRKTKVYRRLCEVTGLFEYRVLGHLESVPPDVVFQVYMDIEYRKFWDPHVKDLYEIQVNDQTAIYWELKYPFPLANRDYIYVRNSKVIEHSGEVAYIVKASSIPSDVPQRVNVVRVSQYVQSVIIAKCGQNGTTAYMEYFDNPGGMIPLYIVNRTVKTGMLDFIASMEKACEGYEDYRRSRKSQIL